MCSGSQQVRSAREHILFYVGDDLFAVKRRNFRIHLKTVENLWAPIQTHLLPPIYEGVNNPGEDNNLMKQELFSHSWGYGPMAELLQQHAASVVEYPNIQPGQPFDGYSIEPMSGNMGADVRSGDGGYRISPR